MLAIIALTASASAGSCQLLDLTSEKMAGNAVDFDVSFVSQGHEHAASMQWKIRYSPAEVWALTITPGPAAMKVGKVPVCNARVGEYICVLAGLNQNLIPDGVVAHIRAATTSGPGSSHLNVTDTVASSANGSMLPLAAGRGFTIGSSPISSLSCSRSQLLLPALVACTVVIASAAPQSGASIKVASASAAAPTFLTIPPNRSSAQFELSLHGPQNQQSTTISAQYGLSSLDTFIYIANPARKSACPPTGAASASAACTGPPNEVSPSPNLSVNAHHSRSSDSEPHPQIKKASAEKSKTCNRGICSFWDDNSIPEIQSSTDGQSLELGIKFQTTTAGYIKAIRFYKGPENLGNHIAHLWTATGELLATARFNNETQTGWQQANFVRPVHLISGAVYIASYYAPRGHYAATNGAFQEEGIHVGGIYAFRDGERGGNGVFRYGNTPSFPTETYHSTNYWVDVVVSAE